MKNKKYLVAQLLMIKRVLEFVFSSAQSTITNSIPNLLTALNNLSSRASAITSLFDQYAAAITGYAAQKKQARLDLVTISFVVMKTAYAWAIDNNDNIMAAKTKTSLAKLKKKGCVTLSNEMTSVIAAVQPIVGSLAPYNANIAAQLTEMQNKLTTLNSLLTVPQSVRKARKDIGELITTEMSGAMNLTRTSIDTIVAANMIAYPQYHTGYFTQREIIDPNIRHNRLDATVQNEVGQPCIDVQVTVMEYFDPDTQKTYPAVTGNTDINGQVTVRQFWPGNRQVKISGPGIIEKTFGPYYFHSGHEVTKVFTVQPDFNNLPSSQTTEEKEKINK